MLALTPSPDRAIPVLWHNFIITFNVPGKLDTVPSAHSRSLASVRFLPQTRTPLRVGAKCGRPHRGSNRALTTGTSVWFQRFRPLGHGGDGGDFSQISQQQLTSVIRHHQSVCNISHICLQLISIYRHQSSNNNCQHKTVVSISVQVPSVNIISYAVTSVNCSLRTKSVYRQCQSISVCR